VSDPNKDPVVQQFREQISDTDLAILDALNRRLSLVEKLHAYKRAQEYDVKDPSREDWMLTWVERANRGPLSPEAVREFWSLLLPLLTREAARLLDTESAAAPR